MARIIQDFRSVAIYGQSINASGVAYNFLVIAVFLTIGAYLFQRNQKYFPEWL